MPAGKTILDEIVEHKKTEIARLPEGKVTSDALRAAVEGQGPRGFIAALRTPRLSGVALIAEVKKASPSAGLICPDFDPVRIATTFEEAGADCLSILTDERFFQGSLAYLRDVRAAVSLPLLRKDFIIDERQIMEAAEWGADAILLIVAILTDTQLLHFHELATNAGLAALVETHDEDELDRALACGARLIGVNNRDLKTFTVDLTTTERLAARLGREKNGSEVLLVSESGIRTRRDVEMVSKSGAAAILAGESLTREKDMAGKIAELLGARPIAKA